MKKLFGGAFLFWGLLISVSASSDTILRIQNPGGEPEYLDPGLSSGKLDTDILNNLFEGLTEYNPKDSSPIPAVATHWTVSPDGKTYTFFLRNDAKWSDGSPVTAHDFEYSWKRALDPKPASRYAFILYYLKNGEAFNKGEIQDSKKIGVEAIDDDTLKVTLKNPTPFFPNLLSFKTFRPVKQSVVEKYGEKWSLSGQSVSNGPYMLKSWVPQNEIVLVKNPYYWDKSNVAIDNVKFFPIEDVSTAIKKYEAGELDVVLELPGTLLPSFKDRPDFHIFAGNMNYFYIFNVKKPPFDNAKLRQAFAMAVDRKTLTDFIMKGTKKPMGHIVPDGMPGYQSPYEISFDPKRAKQLLAESGFPDPTKLPPIELVYNTDVNHKAIAESIQQMWKTHLGVTVSLRNMELKTLLKTKAEGDYQMAREGWVGDYLDPNTFLEIFIGNSPINFSRWANEKYDSILSQAAGETDPGKRLKLLGTAEKILLEEAPIIPIFSESKTFLIKPKVEGFYGNLMNVHPAKFMSFKEED